MDAMAFRRSAGRHETASSYLRLDNIRFNRYCRAMSPSIRQELKQKRAFASAEQEAMLGIRMVAARILAPWERFLKSQADLTSSQYNVLRILRGSHPKAL